MHFWRASFFSILLFCLSSFFTTSMHLLMWLLCCSIAFWCTLSWHFCSSDSRDSSSTRVRLLSKSAGESGVLVAAAETDDDDVVVVATIGVEREAATAAADGTLVEAAVVEQEAAAAAATAAAAAAAADVAGEPGDAGMSTVVGLWQELLLPPLPPPPPPPPELPDEETDWCRPDRVLLTKRSCCRTLLLLLLLLLLLGVWPLLLALLPALTVGAVVGAAGVAATGTAPAGISCVVCEVGGYIGYGTSVCWLGLFVSARADKLLFPPAPPAPPSPGST
uniref:Uncharacterized protein n=1 Tax=Anopheles atroparvus TaxID=41427 RepID=A0A182JAP4_ANOAO